MEIGGAVGSVQVTKAIELEAMPVTGPSVSLHDQHTDETGYVELQGSVNWKRYPPGKITFDWGDGETTIDKFPAKHTYDHAGEYNVNATAKSTTGESGSSSCIVTFSGVIPEIILTKKIYWIDLMKAELDGRVDWHGLDPGDITVDWGDGTKSTRTSFPFEHVYDKSEFRIIIITAKAKTGEKGFAELLLIPAPKPHQEIIGFSLWNRYTCARFSLMLHHTYNQLPPNNHSLAPYLWRHPPQYSDVL